MASYNHENPQRSQLVKVEDSSYDTDLSVPDSSKTHPDIYYSDWMIEVVKMIQGIGKVNLGKLFLYRWGWKDKET